jgi:hypothetical protein
MFSIIGVWMIFENQWSDRDSGRLQYVRQLPQFRCALHRSPIVRYLHWLSVLYRSNFLRYLHVVLYRPRCALQFVTSCYSHLKFVIVVIYCLCFWLKVQTPLQGYRLKIWNTPNPFPATDAFKPSAATRIFSTAHPLLSRKPHRKAAHSCHVT